MAQDNHIPAGAFKAFPDVRVNSTEECLNIALSDWAYTSRIIKSSFGKSSL